MMRKHLRIAAPVALLLVPAVAHAHSIPPILIGLALSPLVALVLACIYGIMAGKWRVLVVHLLLISLWVVLFWIFADNFTSDFVIWSPIVAMMVHILTLLVLIVVRMTRRKEAAD